MRIVIKESNGKTRKIILPTRIIMNRMTALIAPAVLEKKGIEITREQVLRMVREIRGYRRRYLDWKLVEAETSDGDYLEITL